MKEVDALKADNKRMTEALKRIARKDYLKPGHSSAAGIARAALAPRAQEKP